MGGCSRGRTEAGLTKLPSPSRFGKGGGFGRLKSKIEKKGTVAQGNSALKWGGGKSRGIGGTKALGECLGGQGGVAESTKDWSPSGQGGNQTEKFPACLG